MLYYVFLFMAISFSFSAGFLVRATIFRGHYSGQMVITETDTGMTFSMELDKDPELLAFEDEVKFKIIAPDYSKLTSQ